MKLAFALAVLLAPAALADPCNAPLPTTPGTQFGGVVSHLIDADSICVGTGLGGVEVRLGDFDAPELSTPEGKAAKAIATELFLGKHIDCIACLGARGRCRSYDRVIATCSMDGKRLGEMMRERGIREGGR